MPNSQPSFPLLSIVIATRNRVEEAISAIKSILEIPDNRLQLVVQDNSETRQLEKFVLSNITDTRLSYRYSPPPFSSIDNFNAALELARGEYLCLIGDDDGINPEIIEAAAWAKANNIDALATRNIAHFLWPGAAVSSTLFTKVEGGELSITQFSGEIAGVDSKKEVLRLIRNGGVYYLSFRLPKLYHGLVHRRCMESIRERTGAYFSGLSPDIYSAISLSLMANRVFFVDYPLTLPGTSKDRATAWKCPSKTRTYPMGAGPLYRDRNSYQWCELVPRVYCPETIWVDSAIAALRAMGREDIVREINLPKLAAYCIVSNIRITRIVLRDMFVGIWRLGKMPFLSIGALLFELITGPGVIFAKRVLNRIKIVMGKKTEIRISRLGNTQDATRALTRFLKEKQQSFSKYAKDYQG